MNHFDYRDGELFAEDVPVRAIVEAVGTPVYIYASATLTRHFEVMREAAPPGALIAYSVKANGNLSVLRTLAALGAGADIVSEGELRRALAAGIPGQKIVFSGVGKTASELDAALSAQIYQFNVESEGELRLLSEVANGRGRTAPVALRVNPDIDAQTHAKITTGTAESKFGVAWADAERLYALAKDLPGIDACGVDIHIGSQITDLRPLDLAIEKAAGLVRTLRAQGHKITRLDVGGGLGVPYMLEEAPPPLPSAYAKILAGHTRDLDVHVILEPGRLIVANAGILVSRVTYIKEGGLRPFMILDAGMNDLLRPALYDAWHDIKAVRPDGELTAYDVVGPVCESADIFAKDRELPASKAGDLMAILTAGAYGAVQGSSYNARPLTPEVLVKGRQFSVVRRRPTFDEMMQLETWAEWLIPL